jgi:glycosyltransferase involved in cell wall biosynthesis
VSDSPRVSVLLPVRDARGTLVACLESLARQSLEDHEVVAVDDGSADGSGAILARAARRDPRVCVVTTPARGLVPALNLAAARARAPLLARMDADDLADPERLAVQSRRLVEDAPTAILGCRARLLCGPGHHNDGMRAYVAWQNGLVDHDAIVRDLWVESPLAHPTVMMRTSALRALGGYRAFDGPEDYDLWLRAHAAGLRFAKVPEVLLAWRDAPDRLTRRDPRYAAGRFLALKIEALEGAALHGGRPLVLWGAGRVGKAWAKALLARGHRVGAFVEVDPRKIGQVIHGAPVVGVAGATRIAGALHLAAVGQLEARERIRREAARRGLADGHDLLAVA